MTCRIVVLALLALAGACSAAPPAYLDDTRAAARFYCLGDGQPGGELAACQTFLMNR